MMLSEKDKDFITRWEKERERKSSFVEKLLTGLPVAVLFSLPILLFITGVYFFLPVWYTRVSNSMVGSMPAIVIAVFICILFFSYFRMQYKREMNEQLYQELKSKENKARNSTT